MNANESSQIIFEHGYCGNQWRVQISNFNGRVQANVKPWWFNKEGELCPASRHRSLHMPLERLWELGDAITAAKAEMDSETA
jgi:hypothetical protein